MDNPEIFAVGSLPWQLFISLTFARSNDVEPSRAGQIKRRKQFFAFLRKAAEISGVHFSRLLWVLREEAGETTQRLHLHALLAGLPPEKLRRSLVFSLKAFWDWQGKTGIRAGTARISLYNVNLPGVRYVLKGVKEIGSGSSYELSKFRSGSAEIMIADSVFQLLDTATRSPVKHQVSGHGRKLDISSPVKVQSFGT